MRNGSNSESVSGDDVREGLLGAIAIRLKDPVFESQTKNKLGNTEIRSEIVGRVQEAVNKLLHSNKDQAQKLLNKILETQKFRKELNAVKKLARERSKAISIRVPQLRDCKKHYKHTKGQHENSMIFITEGQSAAGSLVSCRDVNTQAIYLLPLVHRSRRSLAHKEIAPVSPNLNVRVSLKHSLETAELYSMLAPICREARRLAART